MDIGCIKRFKCPNKPVQSNGHRSIFYYPGGGTYFGNWKKSKHNLYGEKHSLKGNLTYEGQWKLGMRNGYGTMLKRNKDKTKLIYVGQWKDDMKSGEGKKIYPDGCVYFGQWAQNRRHGIGIQWYADGKIYVGEWEADVHHGLGVMFYINGNRHEGHYARGYKNGEGVFYHNHTGQIQKGMWENDILKTSVMQDEMRHQVDHPTPYPIPKIGLKSPNKLINDLFYQLRSNANKPMRPFIELICLQFNHKYRNFASNEFKYNSPSKLDLYTDFQRTCTCKEEDKLSKYLI